MGDEQKRIEVAELSDGPPLGSLPDETVDLPVVEILTGRGFVTGKSGSGKSNTASVVAENLLDAGFGMLIVDIDGEYYGLKEEYEILHVGADDECDIQVTVDHAEKIASLALEQNVPIILDVSSFLDEGEAEELLTEVSKQLFAKEKKLKQPFLMLVEEVHEWIPEKGSMGECGKMLIKIGKRGRKHGLGMVGISQRPADVKKDFITQCDWLVWHRLTWNNDTKVVSRILDSEYAAAVENLDDGEAFMMNDWSESVQRVQFHRKQTFDAGATPGLDDVDRPDLKSVSSDLVSELSEISEEKKRTEDRIEELREELDRKNSRIGELETELQDARDLSRMADQFVSALVDHVQGPNPGRTEQERMRDRRRREQGNGTVDADAVPTLTMTNGDSSPETNGADPGEEESASAGDEADDGAMPDLAALADVAADNGETEDGAAADDTGFVFDDGMDAVDAAGDESNPEPGDSAGESTEEGVNDDRVDRTGWLLDSDVAVEDAVSTAAEAMASESEDDDAATDYGPSDVDEEAVAAALSNMDDRVVSGPGPSPDAASTAGAGEPGGVVAESGDGGDVRGNATTDSGASPGVDPADREVVTGLVSAVESMPAKTRGMLRYYRKEGPSKPLDAHFAGGGDSEGRSPSGNRPQAGDGDRTNAYAHNRTLRTHGLIEHVGRGHYDYRLRELIEAEYGGHPTDAELDAMVAAVEDAFTKGEQ
jgi:hypothetical protein